MRTLRKHSKWIVFSTSVCNARQHPHLPSPTYPIPSPHIHVQILSQPPFFKVIFASSVAMGDVTALGHESWNDPDSAMDTTSIRQGQWRGTDLNRWNTPPWCSVVLEYLPTKRSHLWGFYVGKYSMHGTHGLDSSHNQGLDQSGCQELVTCKGLCNSERNLWYSGRTMSGMNRTNVANLGSTCF